VPVCMLLSWQPYNLALCAYFDYPLYIFVVCIALLDSVFCAYSCDLIAIMLASTLLAGLLASSAMAAQLTRVNYPNNATSKVEM
jgi:hypothetical protein